MYYTIKINFPEKKWVRTGEPENQESSRGGQQGAGQQGAGKKIWNGRQKEKRQKKSPGKTRA